MKPRKPIKRTPLRRPTYEEAIAWANRERKPIKRGKSPRRVGRKAKREQSAWTLCKAIVISRSGGHCEGNVPNVCPAWAHGATAVHHVWPEDRDCGLHDPERCLHLCVLAHDWAHANPADAKAAGLLRPDASQTPGRGVVSGP